MKNYLADFMRQFDYPNQAQLILFDAYNKTYANANYFEKYEKVRVAYEKDCATDFSFVINLSKNIASLCGVNEYTMHLLTFILLTKSSVAHYEKFGIGMDIWKANFFDLKYKMEECLLVKGVYGVFCPDWYYRFFAVTRFSLGRLQFETSPFGKIYDKNGIKITETDLVIKCHIPRSGIKLTPDLVDESVKLASEFYKDKFGLKRIIFACHSWLLYPENKNILSPTSNLYSFINRFEIIEEEHDYEYHDAWRLFDKDYMGNADELPQDSSLRRAYAERMKKGQPLGEGYGIWVYQN